MTGKRLTRRFYRRDPVTLAKALLGQVLVRRLDDGQELSGRIVETEAYLGIPDKAAHSYGGRRTKRNESMYLDGGHAYVYFVYGMHWCFNVVSDREEVPTAVLIRALEPLEGIGEMKRRRGKERDVDLCTGPAKLTEAMAIGGSLNGIDLVTNECLWLRKGRRVKSDNILSGPRVGISYAKEWAARALRFRLRQKKLKAPPEDGRGLDDF